MGSPGASISRELVLLEEAGLDVEEILRGATSLAARFWGLEGKGVVEEGAKSDIVLGQGEISDDLASVEQKLKLVLIGGRSIDLLFHRPR